MKKSTLITFSAQLALPAPYEKFRCSTDTRTPEGYPPIRLKEIKTFGEAKTAIPAWCHSLRLHFLERGRWLSNDALEYFLRYEYDMDTEKYTRGCKIIQTLSDIQRVAKP